MKLEVLVVLMIIGMLLVSLPINAKDVEGDKKLELREKEINVNTQVVQSDNLVKIVESKKAAGDKKIIELNSEPGEKKFDESKKDAVRHTSTKIFESEDILSSKATSTSIEPVSSSKSTTVSHTKANSQITPIVKPGTSTRTTSNTSHSTSSFTLMTTKPSTKPSQVSMTTPIKSEVKKSSNLLTNTAVIVLKSTSISSSIFATSSSHETMTIKPTSKAVLTSASSLVITTNAVGASMTEKASHRQRRLEILRRQIFDKMRQHQLKRQKMQRTLQKKENQEKREALMKGIIPPLIAHNQMPRQRLPGEQPSDIFNGGKNPVSGEARGQGNVDVPPGMIKGGRNMPIEMSTNDQLVIDLNSEGYMTKSIICDDQVSKNSLTEYIFISYF